MCDILSDGMVRCNKCSKILSLGAFYTRHQRVCHLLASKSVRKKDRAEREDVNVASSFAEDEAQSEINELFLGRVSACQINYLAKQHQLVSYVYGKQAIHATSIEQLVSSMKEDSRIWTGFIEEFRIYEHYNSLDLSAFDIQRNMDFYSKRSQITEQRNWRSISSRMKATLSELIFYHNVNVSYPEAWRIGENIPKVVIRCRDPIECIAYMMADPQIAFDPTFQVASYHLQCGSSKSRVSDGIMSSKWARDTEKEIKLIDEKGILIPFIPYRDKVAVDNMSVKSLDHAVGTIGNFARKHLNKDVSKFSIGVIPELEFEKEIERHLMETFQWSRSKVHKEIQYFKLEIDRKFWETCLQSVYFYAESGLKIYFRGAIVNIFIRIPFIIGDDPAQHQMAGIFGGNCLHSCIQCLMPSREGITLENFQTQYPARNYQKIKDTCKTAEKAIAQRRYGAMSEEGISAISQLTDISIHPIRNIFHYLPMGHRNNLYFMPPDYLHRIGGIVKYVIRWTLHILDQLRKFDNKYRDIFGLLDNRIRQFPFVPNVPHLHWRRFTDITFIIKNESLATKTQVGGKSGRLKTADLFVLLFQFIFCLQGLLKNEAVTVTKTINKIEERHHLGNINIKILSCLICTLDLTFELKRGEWNIQIINNLKTKINNTIRSCLVLHNLFLSILFAEPKTLKSRKLHDILHFPESIHKYGPPSCFDTSAFESFHRQYLKRIYNKTSKRVSSFSEEIIHKMIVNNFVNFLSNRDEFWKKNSVSLFVNSSPTENVWSISRNQKFRRIRVDGGIITFEDADHFQSTCRQFDLNDKKLQLSLLKFLNSMTSMNGIIPAAYFVNIAQFSGSADSGLERGILHAYNYDDRSERFDFVEIKIGSNVDTPTFAVAQICFIIHLSSPECEENIQFVIKYLYKSVIKQRSKVDDESFSLAEISTIYQWSPSCEESLDPRYDVQIVPASVILRTAFVIPSFSNRQANHLYNSERDKFAIRKGRLLQENFFHVERQFFDRTGWEEAETHRLTRPSARILGSGNCSIYSETFCTRSRSSSLNNLSTGSHCIQSFSGASGDINISSKRRRMDPESVELNMGSDSDTPPEYLNIQNGSESEDSDNC